MCLHSLFAKSTTLAHINFHIKVETSFMIYTFSNILLFHVFGIQNSYKLQFLLKGEFAVVPTVKICGRNLSSKIPVDINSIFMKLYVT
jgi:hypothetical protein